MYVSKSRDAPRGGAGRAAAPQILADQKAPPCSGGAPHYYLPPRFLDFETCLPNRKTTEPTIHWKLHKEKNCFQFRSRIGTEVKAIIKLHLLTQSPCITLLLVLKKRFYPIFVLSKLCSKYLVERGFFCLSFTCYEELDCFETSCYLMKFVLSKELVYVQNSQRIVSEIRIVFENTPAIKIFHRKVNSKGLFKYFVKKFLL